MPNKIEKYRAIERILESIFSIDARSLALTRVSVGIILIIDLILRAKDISTFYLASGILPRPGFLGGTDWQWSLHTLVDAWWWVALLFLIHAVCATLLILGFRTRLATLGALALLVSLQHANTMVLNGGDIVIRLLLFFALFVPWGDAYSLDAARRGVMAARAKIYSPWSAALLLQLGLVYLAAGFHKTGLEWANGTAVAYATHSASYARPFGRWIGSFPESLLQFLTYSIVFLQRSAIVLLFAPLKNLWFRLPTVALLMCMHLAFGASLYLGWFPFIEVAALALFLPSNFWDRAEALCAKWGFGRITLYYDGACCFCRTSVFALSAFACLPETTRRPAQESTEALRIMQERNSWVVEDRAGTMHMRYAAVLAMLRASPLFFWLAFVLSHIPGNVEIGNRVYDWVAVNRNRTCPLPESERPIHAWSQPLSALGAATVLVLAVLWNLDNLAVTKLGHDAKHFTHDPWLRALVVPIGLSQGWNFFAPGVLRYEEWPIVRVVFADGREEDPLRGWEPTTWDHPGDTREVFGTRRWRSYFNVLRSRGNPAQAEAAARYFCSLAAQRSGGETAAPIRAEVHWFAGKDLLDREARIQRPILLAGAEC